MDKAVVWSLALAAALTCGCAKKSSHRAATGVPQLEMRTVPDPPEAGDVHVIFSLFDAEGEPMRGKVVVVGASIPPRPPLPAMEVTGTASEDRPGEYGTIVTLSRRGTWSVVGTARDGERVLTERVFRVEIP